MAVLALSAIGAAVGSWAVPGTILGMSGAGFGWMVGSMAGSLLFPPKAPDGPRLEDKAVQVSTYGQPIPRVYGTQRMAGNVIWSTELIETAHEEGGKGGPSYTTYSYRASFAVGVCLGPIAGIRRIWADGKLIFDQSETNTGPQRDFDAQSLAIYTGTDTQLPDPTMQALQGDVPAYRGQAYVVFTDLQLEKFGNRLPSLTFEVVQSGTSEQRGLEVLRDGPADENSRIVITDPETGYLWAIATTLDSINDSVYVTNPLTGALIKRINGSRSDTGVSYSAIAYCPPSRTMWCAYASSGDVDVFGADSYSLLYTLKTPGTGNGGALVWNEANQAMVVGVRGFITFTTAYEYTAQGALTGLSFNPGQMALCGYIEAGESGLLALGPLGYLSAKRCIWVVSNLGDTLNLYAADTYQLLKRVVLAYSQPSAEQARVTFDATRDRLIYMDSTGAYVVIEMGALATSTGSISFAPGASTVNAIHYHAGTDRIYVSAYSSGAGPIGVYDPGTLAYLGHLPSTTGASLYGLIDAPNFDDRMYTVSGDKTYVLYTQPVLIPSAVPLSDVVTAESGLVGLVPSDLDVSALTSVNVAGFAVTSQGAVRSGLEQLMMAYYFDAVESGGVVKFVRRGGAVVATLDDTDLAAHQPGNEVPTPLPITRAEEVELPQRITVRYPNPGADYQTGAQSAQRLTGRSSAQQGVDLPIVLTDSQALQVAEAALYSAWAARTSTTFTTTLKHVALEPTDVIEAGGNTLRITKRLENAGLITFDAAFENGNVYTQSAVGAPADIPLQTIPLRSKTALEFLDLPPLRDQDDDAGYYLAASGYTSGWDGGLVFKSTDGGVSYEELLLLPSAATVGSALDALGSWPEQNTFDEANTVTIYLRSGSLSSLSETAVLNGGNAALLGSEILQFKNATLNADGSYTLHGLLRGRKATPTSGHAAGDRFVLLNTSTLRRAAPVASEVGLERLYKGVSIGATLASATAKAFTNTAQSLEPLAPVHLGGGRSAAGDVAISWKRRTRIGGAWRDYADVPLSEASESYEVDVFADGTYAVLKRTLASATTSLTYTAAQQTTDFGSTQATVYCRVYQLSATNGRGTALQGTV